MMAAADGQHRETSGVLGGGVDRNEANTLVVAC